MTKAYSKKSRFSFMDTVVESGSLRFLIGARLNNFYDLNSTTFLLKFSRETEKSFILVESGKRLHSTRFQRQIKDKQSQFTQKCRQYLKTRKLEDVVQLGVDRVICLIFGHGENRLHLITELYAPGNICLLDHTQTILCILFPKIDQGQELAVGKLYDTSKVRHHEEMSPEYLCDAMKRSYTLSIQRQSDGKKDNKRIKEKQLRGLLLSSVEYGGEIIDYCLEMCHLDPSAEIVIDEIGDEQDDNEKQVESLEQKEKEQEQEKEQEKTIELNDTKEVEGIVSDKKLISKEERKQQRRLQLEQAQLKKQQQNKQTGKKGEGAKTKYQLSADADFIKNLSNQFLQV